MSASLLSTQTLSLYPQPPTLRVDASRTVTPSGSPTLSSPSSVSSVSESEQHLGYSRRSVMDRPRLGERSRSTSIIIPKGGDMYQREKPEYPPGDARAMSPRRSSRDLERLEKNARKSLKDQARTLQSSLAALAERIDEVKSDHDKLESENKFLQDYIGGLTRTMSRDGIGSATKKSKK